MRASKNKMLFSKAKNMEYLAIHLVLIVFKEFTLLEVKINSKCLPGKEAW
jgi:hypothetical protein